MKDRAVDLRAIKGAAVLGPVKAKPYGWPRRRGPALTDPARAGCDNCGRDGRMLAARVEQKNGPTLHATLDQTIMSNQHETSVERMITMDRNQ
jgi:hypothetical protein